MADENASVGPGNAGEELSAAWLSELHGTNRSGYGVQIGNHMEQLISRNEYGTGEELGHHFFGVVNGPMWNTWGKGYGSLSNFPDPTCPDAACGALFLPPSILFIIFFSSLGR